MTNKNQKMLREIANDTQTPKKRDSKVQNDLWENINDDEFWEGLGLRYRCSIKSLINKL